MKKYNNKQTSLQFHNEKQRLNNMQKEFNEASKIFEDRYGVIARRYEDIKSKQHDLIKLHEGDRVSDYDYFIINAGGEIIPTTRGILTSIKGSRLAAMFSGRWESELITDDNNHIFLDVDGETFRAIVNYLQEIKQFNDSAFDQTFHPPNIEIGSSSLSLRYLISYLGLTKNNQSLPIPVDSTIMTGLESKYYESLHNFLSDSEVHGHLELLYRASRDGWSASAFHNKCDNKGATVTLIQSIGGYVFGGYADTPWRSDEGWKESPKAFLFSLKCHAGLEPTKMKQKATNQQYAIMHDSSCGPTFGGGYDIHVANNANSNTSSRINFSSYECPPGQNGETFLTGSRNFQVQEIEVFRVDESKIRKFILHHDSASSSTSDSAKSSEEENWKSIKFHGFPNKLKQSLEEEQKELTSAWNMIDQLEKDFEKEKAFMKSFLNCDKSDTIHFDVEGKRISVKRSTIEQFPQSVLPEQIAKKKTITLEQKQMKQEQDIRTVQDWRVEQVVDWAKADDKLPTEVSDALSQHKIKGKELLVFQREDWKAIEIDRAGTVALAMDAIQKLKDTTGKFSNKDVITIDNTNAYCFSKMIELLRLRTISQEMKWDFVAVSIIEESEREEFKKLIKRYFPKMEDSEWFNI